MCCFFLRHFDISALNDQKVKGQHGEANQGHGDGGQGYKVSYVTGVRWVRCHGNEHYIFYFILVIICIQNLIYFIVADI